MIEKRDDDIQGLEEELAKFQTASERWNKLSKNLDEFANLLKKEEKDRKTSGQQKNEAIEKLCKNFSQLEEELNKVEKQLKELQLKNQVQLQVPPKV